MKGYQALYNEGKLNKNDGVIVFIRETLYFSYSIKDILEIKALQIIIENRNYKISITALYRSPNTCPIQFNIGMETYLEKIGNNDIQIITGDINIDTLSEYQNLMNAHGFISYINDVTRPSSGSCIDNFFIKCKHQLKFKSFIIQSCITDHFPIAVTLQSENQQTYIKPENEYIKFINYIKLRKELREELWCDICNQDDTDKIARDFVGKIKLSIENSTVTVN